MTHLVYAFLAGFIVTVLVGSDFGRGLLKGALVLTLLALAALGALSLSVLL